MTEQPPAAPDRSGWPRRLLTAVAIALAAVIIALATGLPQRGVLQAALNGALNGRVEVGKVSAVGAVKISRLALYAPHDPQGSPAVLLENLKLDYSLLPRNGRHVQSLTIDRLDIDAAKLRRIPPKKPARKAKPSKFNADSLAPQQIEIKSLNLKATTPSYALSAEGLYVTAQIQSVSRFQAAVQGDNVSVSIWTRSGDWSRDIDGGKINIAVARDGDTVDVQPAVADLPGLLELAASARVAGKHVAVDVEKLTAQDVDLSRADLNDLAVPFAFDRVDMSGTAVEGDVLIGALSISVPETDVKLAADDLVLGPQGAEYYQGDLAVELTGAAGPQADYALTATLNRGQKITAGLKGHHLACSGRASLRDWSREDLLAALPANMRGGVSYLPLLERVDSAEVDFEWNMPELAVDGAVDGLFVVQGEERPARLTFSGHGPLAPKDRAAFEVKADAQLAGGEVAVSSVLSSMPARTTLEIRNVDPAKWLYTLTERDMLDDLHASFSGAVAVEPGAGRKQLKAAVDLQAAPFGYGPVSMPEGQTLSIGGDLEADTGTFGHVRGPELMLRVNEDTALVLRGWNMPLDNFALTGDVDLKLDLAMLEHMAPGSDLRGRLALHGPLVNDRGYMNLEFEGSIEGLGYGNYAAPYGVPIEATGMFSFDNLNGRLTGRNFALKLPEATSLASDGWTFEGSTAKLTAPFTLTTDFQPLVPMGLIDDVGGGHGAVTGTFVYGEAGARLDASLKAAADTMVVGGARAALTGLEAQASLAKPAGAPVAGEGNVKAAKIAAMGAVFEQAEGPVTLENGVLRAPKLKGSLYGGSATAEVEAGLAEAGLPVRLSAAVASVDLGLFTGTLGVPAVEMTGRASGHAELAMDYAGGIRDFEADLRSSDNFSVNTRLLEQLLAMQFAKQYAGERQMEKIKARILGQEDQRPFDSGRLVLNYRGDRVGGEASLKSENLDLTVDLKIDKEALVSALEFAQENRIDRLGIAAGSN